MQDNWTQEDAEELELYRAALKKHNEEKPKFTDKLCGWLGTVIAYAVWVWILFFCWNLVLIKLFPVIPKTQPLEMAGLWLLCSLLLGRR